MSYRGVKAGLEPTGGLEPPNLVLTKNALCQLSYVGALIATIQVCTYLQYLSVSTLRFGWAVKDSNLRRAKPDWFTASSDCPLRHLPLD